MDEKKAKKSEVHFANDDPTEFPHDDIQLSDEHYEYGFFSLEEISVMKGISRSYRKAIKKALQGDIKTKTVKIKFGSHGAAGMVSAGPR